MSEWKPYLKQRKIKHHESGFAIIVPQDMPEVIPLCCPVCNCAMRTPADEQAYEKWRCCDWCAMLWAYPNKAKWLEGWRPSQDQVARALEQRPKLSFVFDFD